jgi:hypothetical protein
MVLKMPSKKQQNSMVCKLLKPAILNSLCWSPVQDPYFAFQHTNNNIAFTSFTATP